LERGRGPCDHVEVRLLAIGLSCAALALAMGTSCVVELQHTLVCGDGYVDESVGEECDPSLPESYEQGCDGTGIAGRAHCDEVTCTIVCEGCGDGVVQRAEGDALVDEECDEGPYAGARALETEAVDCVALRSGDTQTPYGSGTTRYCTSACFYDRTPCSYCGNGSADDVLDLAPSLSGQVATASAEDCDGDEFRPSFKASTCPGNVELNATCGEDCRIVPRSDPPCCVPKGGPCGQATPCCHVFTHPGVPMHCLNPITGEEVDEDSPPPDATCL
jgi:hypothetical protein